MGTTLQQDQWSLDDQALLRQARRDWNKAWRYQVMPPVQKQLLEAIYLRLGDELHTIASQERLGQDIGRSARTVGRHLPALVKAGWLVRQERVTRSGRLSDKLQIAIDGDTSFFYARPRQNVVAPPPDCQGEKDLSGKASEQSSSAAYAREDGPQATGGDLPTSQQAAAQETAQGQMGDRGKPQSGAPSGSQGEAQGTAQSKAQDSRQGRQGDQPGRRRDPQQEEPRRPRPRVTKQGARQARGKRRKAPVLGYVRDLLALWKELVLQEGRPAPAPDPMRMGDYRADELETAFSTLLERMHDGVVLTPKGLFMHLVKVTHLGEVQPRRYDAASLRRIAAGQPRHHAHGLRRRPAPEPPPDPEALRRQAEQEAAARQQRQQESQARADDDRVRMEAAVRGTTSQQPGGALQALAKEENIFLAAEVLAAAWGWSSPVAFGELHRTRQAQEQAEERRKGQAKGPASKEEHSESRQRGKQSQQGRKVSPPEGVEVEDE